MYRLALEQESVLPCIHHISTHSLAGWQANPIPLGVVVIADRPEKVPLALVIALCLLVIFVFKAEITGAGKVVVSGR